jgi:hypothetical protein
MKIIGGKTGKTFSHLFPSNGKNSGKMAVWLYANPLSRFPVIHRPAWQIIDE